MTCNHSFQDINELDSDCVACWKERAEKAETGCAEMREAITDFVGESGWQIELFLHDQFPATVGNRALHSWIDRLAKSAATDCGKGWLSPERAAELQAKLDRYAVEHPSICYQCGNEVADPSKVKLLVEALQNIVNKTVQMTVMKIATDALAAVKEKP